MAQTADMYLHHEHSLRDVEPYWQHPSQLAGLLLMRYCLRTAKTADALQMQWNLQQNQQTLIYTDVVHHLCATHFGTTAHHAGNVNVLQSPWCAQLQVAVHTCICFLRRAEGRRPYWIIWREGPIPLML